MSGAVSAMALLGPGLGLTYEGLKPPDIPKPKPPAAVKPPQRSRMPDEQGRRRQRTQAAGGGGGGAFGTLLTGAGGVGADTLNLGRSTLLGQ